MSFLSLVWHFMTSKIFQGTLKCFTYCARSCVIDSTRSRVLVGPGSGSLFKQ